MRALPPPALLRRASGVALLMVFLGFIGAPRVCAAARDEGFVRGNGLYAAGRFTEAAAAYETQVQHGDYSANLFYNLGDAYYRLGSRGRAILNYRRALLLEPSHAEATANLAFIGGASRAATTRGLNVSVDALYWLTAGAVWLAAAGLLTRWLARRWRVFGMLLTLVGLAGCAAGAGLLWQADGLTRHSALALVIVADVPAHYSPADNSKVITKLSEGAEIRVLSAQGAWTYALLEDGTRAWVASDKVEALVPLRS